MKALTAILLAILSSSLFAKDYQPAKIYSWWGYISKEVKQDLNKSRYKINLSIYKSNEKAITHLFSNKNKYELAILSNFAIDVLTKYNIFEKVLAKEINSKRDYFPHLLKMVNNQCVPYLWSVTTFVSKNIENEKIENLNQLISLKSKNIKIGLIDDPFEVFSRHFADNYKRCNSLKKNNIFSHKKCLNNFKFDNFSIEPNDFSTDILDFKKHKNFATYSWHGEAAQLLGKKNNLNFHLPQSNPTVGSDYVCFLKNNKITNKRRRQIVNFVKKLTNKHLTAKHVRDFQYFSPYKRHTKGLKPKTLNLYKKISNKVDKNNYFYLSAPSQSFHKKINIWWKKIRHEKKH